MGTNIFANNSKGMGKEDNRTSNDSESALHEDSNQILMSTSKGGRSMWQVSV
jgi:hypothetical protein